MCPLYFLTPTRPDQRVRTLASWRAWTKDSA